MTVVILGWLMFHRRQWSGCALLMENLLVLARKESPHQADYCEKAVGDGENQDEPVESSDV